MGRKSKKLAAQGVTEVQAVVENQDGSVSPASIPEGPDPLEPARELFVPASAQSSEASESVVEGEGEPVDGDDLPPAVGGKGVKLKTKGRAKPPTRYAKFGGQNVGDQ